MSPLLLLRLIHPTADTTRALYSKDVAAIEAMVCALEAKLRDIRTRIAREAAAIPQVEAVVAACTLQRQHLAHIAAHLPAYLPSLRSPEVGGAAAAKENTGGSGSNAAPAAQHQKAAAAEGGAAAKKQRPPAPRRWDSWVLRGALCRSRPFISRRLVRSLQPTSPQPPLSRPSAASSSLHLPHTPPLHPGTSLPMSWRRFPPTCAAA